MKESMYFKFYLRRESLYVLFLEKLPENYDSEKLPEHYNFEKLAENSNLETLLENYDFESYIRKI